jgi:hypothetical protein
MVTMADGSRRREPSERELAASLAQLGPALDLGPDPGSGFAFAVSAAVVRYGERPAGRTEPRPGVRTRVRSWLLWQRPARRALVLAMALVVILAVAAAAATFGVRGVRLIFGPAPTSSVAPSSLTPTASAPSGPAASVPASSPPSQGFVLGIPMSLHEARARVGFHVSVPSAPNLGPPAVYLSDAVPGGAVTLVYPPGPGIPAVGSSGVGISITEFVGRVDGAFINKYIGSGTTVKDVDVGGVSGLWVSGAPHEIAYVGADGSFVHGTFRFSGPALLWQLGDVTLRLESMLTERRAVEVASSVP